MNRQEICVVTGQTRNICERFQKGHEKITECPVQCTFGGLILPFSVFYLFYSSERRWKTIKKANDSNH